MVPIGWCTSVQFMINNLLVWAVMWNGPLFMFTLHWLNGGYMFLGSTRMVEVFLLEGDIFLKGHDFQVP